MFLKEIPVSPHDVPDCNFTPVPVLTIESPDQIKAFTDPLRIRVLGVLRRRAATNQQVADTLGEAHSKVLYHIRYLLEVGLIQLVDTRIKGGNVEKYYRAVAHIFNLRPASYDVELDAAVVKPAVERLRTEMLASLMLYPAFDAYMHMRDSYLSEERIAAFNERLCDLMEEFWPVDNKAEDGEKTRLAVFIYRDPGDLTHG
jgi:DNA-binding transcriptional ArsR family regulator